MLPINIDNLSSYLAPPKGYSFDSGFTTTYSLHLDILLTIPMFLDGGLDEKYAVSKNYLMIVKMIERYKEKFKVYVQKGEIKTSTKAFSKASNLYQLLQPMIIEIQKDTKINSFHPKTWLLRYANGDGYKYKFIVLSKNITNSSDFDIAIAFDGEKHKDSPHKQINLKLYNFYTSIEKKLRLFKEEEIINIKWENVDGFELKDILIIPNDKDIPLIENNTLKENAIVFSPFITESLFRKNNILVTREEEIKLDIECENIYKLNGALEDSDDINTSAQLHAKIYLFQNNEREKGTLVLGSSNCTNRGLFKNNELNIVLSTPTGFYDQIKKYITDEKKRVFVKADLEEAKKIQKKQKDRMIILGELDTLKNQLLQKNNLTIKSKYDANKLILAISLNNKIEILSDIKIDISPVSIESYKEINNQVGNLEWDVNLASATGWFILKLTKDSYSREFLIEDKDFIMTSETKDAIFDEAQKNSQDFFEYNIRALLNDGRKNVLNIQEHYEKNDEHDESCYGEIIENDLVDMMIDRYASNISIYKEVYEMLESNDSYSEIIKCLPKI